MKKLAMAAFAAALCVCSTVGVYAAEANQDSTEGLGSDFTYTHANAPSYVITIPSQVVLSKQGTEVAITASDVEDLDGQSISVTVEGTDYYRNQFVLQGDTRPSTSIRYSLTLADGTVLETTGGKDEHVGKELASFSSNSTKTYIVTPIIKADTVAGADYTGTLTYGIALV